MLLISLSLTLATLLVIMALRISRSHRFVGYGILLVTSCMSYIILRTYLNDICAGWVSAKADVVNIARQAGLAPPPHLQQVPWPPVVGQPYPDLNLIDQQGRRTSLSEFKGKVVLIEPVGMPCRACVSFAGGHDRGPFNGVDPQKDLQSIEQYARDYGDVDLDDERIAIVQILFYSNQMDAPTPEDARRWARHFGMDRSKNRVVLAAEPYLLSQQTHNMIPGFQLIDKNFVLRYDSTGHQPKHDLYSELLPNVRKLLEEKAE